MLGATPAFADVLGRGCEKPDVPPPDMSMPRDLSPSRDLAAPSDLSGLRDARLERRRRHRAAGAGMIVLSGRGACGVAMARRRVRA